MGRLSPQLATAEPQARSPERQRLADAIENLAKAKAALAHIRDVIGFQVDKGLDADRTLHEALARLEELGADDAAALAAQALGDDASSRTLREARAAVEAAQEQVRLRDVTRQGLREREEEAGKAVAVAETSLRSAHLAACSADPAIRNIIARFEAARREMAGLRLVMKEIEAYLPYGYRWDEAEHFKRYDALDQTELNCWRASIAALKLDPDFELP